MAERAVHSHGCFAWAPIVAALVMLWGAGCQTPDPYYRHRDTGANTGGVGIGGNPLPPDGSGGADGRGGMGFVVGSGGTTGGGTGGTSAGNDAAIEDAGVDVIFSAGDAGSETGGYQPICADCKLIGLYQCFNPATNTNLMRPWFKIANNTGQTIPLSQVTLRYWFTAKDTKSWQLTCDYAWVGAMNVVATFEVVTPPRLGADRYLQIAFLPGAGALPPFGDSGELRNRVERVDYATFTQTDDYSFDATKLGSFWEWDHVTVYWNGVLVGGVEPRTR